MSSWPSFQVKSNPTPSGQVLILPPASGRQSQRTFQIPMELVRQLSGHPLPECPISTIDGVRAADIGWFSNERFAEVKGQLAFERAPEICVGSPRNTQHEMAAKRKLYFDAGTEEVWLCEEDGSLAFYMMEAPGEAKKSSSRCPDFPHKL